MSFRARTALFGILLAAAAACNTAELTPRASGPGDPAPGGPSNPRPDGGAGGLDGEAPAGDAAAVPVSHAVRIQVMPSDDGAALLAAITAATTSVHMTMYLLTNNDISDALIARRRAGVDVKVVLNKNFPQGGNANQSSFARLTSGGVPVVWAPAAFSFVHSKAILIDGKQAWIMTMNATFTSPRDNREYLAIDDEPADLAQAEAIFQGDFTDKQSQGDGPLVVSPVNASARLLALAASARRSLDVEAETLAETSIVNAIVAAHERGVAVRVVLSIDFTSAGEEQAIATLKAKKVPLVSLAQPYVHAKAMVADGARAYVGSVNFTATSLSRNREMGVITDAPAEAKKVSDTIAGDFARGTAL